MHYQICEAKTHSASNFLLNIEDKLNNSEWDLLQHMTPQTLEIFYC